MARDRNEWLQQFKRNKRNRTVRDAEDLLEAWGWTVDRKTSKEGLLWTKGNEVFLFPNSRGRPLKLGYISALIQAIRRADPQPLEGADDDADRDD